MIEYSKILSMTLLLAVSGVGSAQQVGMNLEDEESGEDAPSDFIHKGQVVPVAVDDIDEGDDYTVPEIDDNERLLAEFDLFKQLMGDNVLDEADTVAKRVVSLSIQTHGPQSNEYAKALTNLAIVQYRTEQFDSSIQNFETAIEVIEDNDDRLNAQLINPLKGLGAAQLEYGRPDLASRTFQRAVHVTHVNEGPHNLEQIDLLESIAETYVRMGDMDEAKEAQDTIYALNIREHRLDTPELIPSLLRRAEWQHRAGFIYDERATYRRAIRIIERSKGKDSSDLVAPLILLGRSYFYIDTSGQTSFHDGNMTSGEIYFRRAARIATESPDTDWQIVAQATLALGDYYMYSNNPQRARQVFTDAWEQLSEGEEQLDVRRKQLEQVVPLKQNKLPLYVSSGDDAPAENRDEAMLQGSVSIGYEVSARGRANNLSLVDAQPPEFEPMITTVHRELRRRIFRPRMVDGEIVQTPDLILMHKYYYRQSDLDAARAAVEAEED